MKKLLISLFLILLLTGCGRQTYENGEVNVLNWSSYIPEDVIKDFEEGLKEDGYVKVTKGEGMMFAKNNANGGFSYVYIAASCKEIEYGASTNGTYDLILDRQKH